MHRSIKRKTKHVVATITSETRRYRPNIAEYNSLRQEILERITLMNSQNSSAIQVIIPLWVAGFTLMGIRLGGDIDSIMVKIGLCWGESIAFYVVIPILCSMAIRSAENIRQIAALGSFIRVHYELLPKVIGTNNKGAEQFFWESMDAAASKLKKSDEKTCLQKRFLNGLIFYNREYLWMALTSLAFWVVSLISFRLTVLQNEDISKIVVFFSIVRQILIIIDGIIALLFLLRVFSDTSVSMIFNMHYKACIRVYIKELRINDVINATEKEKLERILELD